MTLSDNLRGAGLMMASMALFTINDAFMKSLAGEVPLDQAVFLRGLITVVVMLGLLRLIGTPRVALSRRDRGLILVRNCAEVATSYLFLQALFNMPIANASAIMQATPLTVSLAGAVFLGQAIGWRRLLAILLGFGGILMIVRPGLEGFTVYSLYALGAVLMVTARDIFARMISPEVPSLMIASSNAVSVTLAFGIAFLFTSWEPMELSHALNLMGAALAIVGAYFCAVATMRQVDIAFIAPFRYTSLLSAIVLGLAIFGEVPDALTLLGGAIVVATGVFTLWREGQRRKAVLR